MKLSDYLARYVSERLADAVFGYQGSSVSHIIDSLAHAPSLTFMETRHEQGAAFAACGYALARRDVGVAVACSGPGATNLITGIANAYYDSLPCLFVTGQVSTRELRTDPAMRQFGFQETDIVSMVGPITKYAVQLKRPERIAYELEKAEHWMRAGRPGPVLLDIPHDIQRSEIDPDNLEHYAPPPPPCDRAALEAACRGAAARFGRSNRPVILLGGGGGPLAQRADLMAFLKGLSVPVVSSYRGKDILENTDPRYCGVLGAYGDRSANWAVKLSDMLLVLGSRLDGRQTGGDDAAFADGADIVMVDIDPAELAAKPARYLKVSADVCDFVRELSAQGDMRPKDGGWLSTVQAWRARYPIEREYSAGEGVNPNHLLGRIAALAKPGALFAVDVGQNQVWANTSLTLGPGMRLMQSCGLGSMGYALPAAIGGCCARPEQAVAICGDGGFQMNLQELQTIAHNKLPVKTVVLNNQSLGLIRVYQQKALSGRLAGSVDGFGSPDYRLLAEAYGLRYARIDGDDCDGAIREFLESPEPWLVEAIVSGASTCCPEPTYLAAVEDQSPVLSDAQKQTLREEARKHADA